MEITTDVCDVKKSEAFLAEDRDHHYNGKSFADACINEEMRVSFMEAGAVKPLVQLLANSNKKAAKIPVICALKNLSLSRTVCKRIEAEGADESDALGDVYIWGEVIFDNVVKVGIDKNASYLTTRTDVLVPKPLESNIVLDVHQIACGVRHAAFVTRQGEVFTWGEESGGRLGHGIGKDVFHPRLFESLTATTSSVDFVACGEFHTCAVTLTGELYTWGDGSDISHGIPKKIAGPLEGLHKLASEFIEEISCGAYHVAALTSRNEVYTWGKGANGRLGHGDLEDRKVPTLVEALKDRHVKYVACGSNYTAAICPHKWVSGAEQSQCSACRLAFDFTRKRHNCYNCGLVHCHSCSSKKTFRAALAPSAGRLYRVCDSCYVKLSKVSEISETHSRRNSVVPRLSGENKDRLDKSEIRLAKFGTSNMDLLKQLDSAAKQGKKSDNFALGRNSQLPSLMQLKDAVQSNVGRSTPKLVQAPSGISSRSVSPFFRRSSPPRSATPMPSTSGIYFPVGVSDNVRKTNEMLNQGIIKLRTQVDSLTQKCELQEVELKNSVKKTQEALALADDKSSIQSSSSAYRKQVSLFYRHQQPSLTRFIQLKRVRQGSGCPQPPPYSVRGYNIGEPKNILELSCSQSAPTRRSAVTDVSLLMNPPPHLSTRLCHILRRLLGLQTRSLACIAALFSSLVVVKARSSPGSSTDSRVDALLSIMGKFGYNPLLADTWIGNDPCEGWYGLTCVEDQITYIMLPSMNLTGSISKRIAELTSVHMIDLSHNLLTGTIPSELTKLELIFLDLSYNRLHGSVPHLKTTFLNILGNPEILRDVTSRSRHHHTIAWALSGGFLGLFFF